MLKKENSLIRAALAAALILGAGLSAGQALANHNQPGIPEHLIPDRDACEKTGKLREEKSSGMVDAACFIKYTEAWTNRTWDGCWIHNADGFWHNNVGLANYIPNCRQIFGNPPNFPENPGDAAYVIGCDIIGMVDSDDRLSCECPSDRQVLRADGESGTERCVTEEENGWADSCLENGGEISEVRNNDYREDESHKALFVSAFFCDFPYRLFIGRAEHDGCVLYGPGDETARAGRPRCGDPGLDVSGIVNGRTPPSGLPEHLTADYFNCKDNHRTVEYAGFFGSRPVLDIGCQLKFLDVASGTEWEGCWIDNVPYIAISDFKHQGIQDWSPKCRDFFGSPAVFPETGGSPGDAVYATNCEKIGRTASRDRLSCECPPERPNSWRNGADGIERCLSDEEADLADVCEANKWKISETGESVPVAALTSDVLCHLPVSQAHEGADHDACVLSGPGEDSGNPPCVEMDFDAVVAEIEAAARAAEEAAARAAEEAAARAAEEAAARAEAEAAARAAEEAAARAAEEAAAKAAEAARQGIPQGLPEEFWQEFLDCDANYTILMESNENAVDVACSVTTKDALSGNEYTDSCWIYKSPADVATALGRTNFFPNCRDYYGNPTDFGNIPYVVRCESIGRAGAPDGQSCICPHNRPHARHDGQDGREWCLTNEEAESVEGCLDSGGELVEVVSNAGYYVEGASYGADPGFFCDFPVPVFIGGAYGKKAHAGCFLYGLGSETARASDLPCSDFDFEALADNAFALSDEERERAPKGLPSDRVKEYISCDDHHTVVEESRLFVDKVHGTDEVWRPTDAVCAVNIADARTGDNWNACWIYNEPELEDNYKFTAYKIHPDCREIFGDPADFSTTARDSVRVIGCEAIGRTTSRAGDKCICPAETPRERFDGRTGAQICVNDEANDLANACAENGWTITEVLAGDTRADSLNASFFCQIPVHNYGGENYDGCGLYGPAVVEGGRPSCAEVDVFAGRDASYAYDCGGEKVHLDGACACPPERPELFAYRDRELCLGDDVKLMADLCKGNGWRIQNIGGETPPQLACVMTRKQR